MNKQVANIQTQELRYSFFSLMQLYVMSILLLKNILVITFSDCIIFHNIGNFLHTTIFLSWNV